MKKMTAILLTLVMLMSLSTVVYADEWDFLNNKYTSVDCEVQVYFSLNKPLLFLEGLDDEMDVKRIVESFFESKINMNVKGEISEDMTKSKTEMAINMFVPVELNEDLKLSGDVTVHMWTESDATSVENAKNISIIKNPVTGKYMYRDAFSGYVSEGGVNAAKETFVDVMKMTGSLSEVQKAAYRDNAKLEKTVDGYNITMRNEQLIDFGATIIGSVFTSDYFEELGLDMSELGMEGVSSEQVISIAKALGIFADEDALVYDIKLDDKGYMTEGEEKIHLDFNIYEVATFFGATDEDIAPITKENSDIDLTIGVKLKYNKVNDGVSVELPVLTAENSTGLYEDYEIYEEDMYYEVYQPEKFRDTASGKMEREGMYVDAAEYFNECYWDSDDLDGEVVLDENGNVTMKISSLNFEPVIVMGNVNENNYYINGIELWGRKPFMTNTGYDWDTYESVQSVYVNVDVLNWILGTKVVAVKAYIADYDGMSLTNPEYEFEMIRNNPAYLGE